MVIAKSKKVRPSITNTIKSMDYTWTAETEPPADNKEATGVPTAIFLPHGNTLPFEERRLTLEQPIKIGRNVYRATPAPNNAIFECRVLSRHHATLFYKNGHFYLIDNQSSNGTFINNDKKCSTKTEEPHEVFSGDIIKFGISVVENVPKSGLNTFPPVIAMLKLFHPDGKEAKMSFNPTMSVPLDLKELYQLHNFVQEAIGREASLEGRLKSLKDCATRTRAAAQSSWELFVGEQRLLMRVRTLENMLASGKHPESHHVAMLLDEKKNYQEVAQESLRAAHEQRFALEEMLERRSREASALQQHNCALRQAANNALTELQKLAGRCERKMTAARAAIAAAEGKEAAIRARLPQALYMQGSVQAEAKMLVLSADGDRSGDANKGSIEEAIKALPDYIKMLLPAHVLNKVGLKTVNADAKSGKEFELILNTNNHQNYDTNECKEKAEVTEKKEGHSSSEEEGGSPEHPDICTDDEKQSRLNHDGVVVDEAESDRAEGALPDNNANSTYTENDNRDEDTSKSGIDIPNILFIMSGLNDEIKALRERLNASIAENQQLREIRDELLATNSEQKDDNSVEIEDAASYRARIAELQAQLARSTVVEEANLAEIQRLASSAAVMHAELAFRPTRQDLDDLNDHLSHLKAELMQRDDVINNFNRDKSSIPLAVPTEDKETETEKELVSEDSKFEDETMDTSELDVGKVAAEIDDLFKLDYEDDDEHDDHDETTDSADTVVMDDHSAVQEVEVRVTDYVKIPDEERLISTLANGSLHVLEEELVRAKERWEEISKEKAVLVEQLATLEKKHAFNPGRFLALMVPIIAVFTYWLLLPYVS